MQVYENIQEFKNQIKSIKQANLSIGFVPTMGYLHEGHLSLVEAAKNENDIVIMSIFVNPLQFGPNEDYSTYPRDFGRDKELAEEAGVDLIFAPQPEEMYPRTPSIQFTVSERVNVLCGRKREGHFDGVAAVLTKLFHLAEPDRAYFGLKDAQQVAVVDGLIKDFNFPIQLSPVETVREEDGLAKSSRNVKLTSEERREAPEIYAALKYGKDMFLSGIGAEDVERMISERLRERTSGTVDYVEIYEYPFLKAPDQSSEKIIIAAALQYSNARLIDNVIFSTGVREGDSTCLEQ
ncbi:pantoate--beta-alanine ligase [Falsibacillus albus]|uniref:Pantothenate synthetase n=1 Tax=Falsibacillus albus TaxID=2478915 RepID=A0A3L7JXU9_9BACI|nr:pantoate--beta-alanine ligase [Falsibacillus albus]RLQ95125.1 pantoate--beta-alanine ligase [Falsibacillus albus]